MHRSLLRLVATGMLAFSTLLIGFFGIVLALVAVGVPPLSAGMAGLFLLVALAEGAVSGIVRLMRPSTPQEPEPAQTPPPPL